MTEGSFHFSIQSVTLVSLTIRDITWDQSVEEYALDVVVDKMRCLQTLRIRGASASELMLHRRSDVFVKCGRSSGLPVVQLSLHFVPKLRRYRLESWREWQLIEFECWDFQ